MNFKEIAEEYMTDVMSGEIPACKWVKLAIKRHRKDLKRKDVNFDEEEATRVLSFISITRFTKGKHAKEHFNLQPFQVWLVWVLFGWQKNGQRRFRKAYIEEARKNGKSELAGAIALYGLLADKEEGAEVYSTATKRDQAKIVFDVAKVMGRRLKQDSSAVSEKLGVFEHNLHVLSTNSKLEPLSSDSRTLDGLNPHFAIVDEYHAHKDDELVKVIETGQGAREQPLLFIITTAGFNKFGPCYNLRKVVCNLLDGKMKDDTTFGVIYTLDEGDDWKDEKVWIKANPNIGVTPTWEYMRSQKVKAQNEGYTAAVQFQTKNANIWTDSSSTWISDEDWMKCKGKPTREGKCWASIDLASTSDTTCLMIKYENGSLFPYFFLPEETTNKKEGVNYKEWASQGHLIQCNGSAMDWEWLADEMYERLEDHKPELIAVDSWKIDNLLPQLLRKKGIDEDRFFKHGQGYRDMDSSVHEVEKKVANQEITHDNPVMRWQMGNVEITTDSSGNIKIDKRKSSEKVDGPVCLAMVLSAEMIEDEGDSIYNERGIVSI